MNFLSRLLLKRARVFLISWLIIFAIGFVVVANKAFSADDPFMRENPDVEAGNRAIGEQVYGDALEAYERAARSLPGEAGVHLNRGIALLHQALEARGELPAAAAPSNPINIFGNTPSQDAPDDGPSNGFTSALQTARESLLRAIDPDASASLRADAYYNIGLTFYYQGDTVAAREEHEEAQRWFREAIDAFERSLRLRPADRDTAWNLELAVRRLNESQQEQERQEQEQEGNEEQEQQDQNQEQGGGDGDDNAEDNQDESSPDESEQSEQEQEGDDDPSDERESGDDEQSADQGDDQQPEQEDQPEQDEGQGSPEDEQSDQNDGSPQPGPQQERRQDALPQDVARALDNLEESEESYQRQRARMRGRRENRRPTKDW